MGHHFISHSSADATAFAQEHCDQLESGSPAFKVWLERRKTPKPGHDEIKLGRDWDEEIDQAIRSCESLLFVMSRDGVRANSVCKEEWMSAPHYKKAIIPPLLHRDAGAPPRLRKREHIYQLEVWGYNRPRAQHYQRLIEHVGLEGVKAACQNQLGWVLYRVAEYEQAVACFKNSIE